MEHRITASEGRKIKALKTGEQTLWLDPPCTTVAVQSPIGAVEAVYDLPPEDGPQVEGDDP